MSPLNVIGRYEIIEELGRGAMGSVFKARDPAVGRTVALKTVHAAALAGEQGDEYRQRFYREARASGVLAHPGIVPVFDVGDHDGAPFLVMEFVDGRTLADAVKKGERFSLDRVCEIGQLIAEALGYAHRRGVIHRDIKPANILLTSTEVYGSERPRITDFGIAKLAASDITTTGQLLGTPSYMPPEQFTGSPVDGRADVFSLGVILYNLVTGEQPFPGETMTAVSYKVVYTEPVPPSKLNPATPMRLEKAIERCLAKSPADRFQTCEELAQELAAIRASLAGATVPAKPDLVPIGSLDTLGPGLNEVSGTGGQSVAAQTQTASKKPPAAKLDKKKPEQAQGSPAKKLVKQLSFESIFGVMLLGIAGVAVTAAGGWFFYQRVRTALEEHWKKPVVSSTTTVPPIVQPVVQVPQPNTATTDQNQTPPGSTTPETSATRAEESTAGPAGATSKSSRAAGAKAKATSGAKSKTATQTAPASGPVLSNPTVASSTPAPSSPSSASTSAPATAATAAAASAASGGSKTASATFDPRKLDPNTSTKLRIDASKMPNGLPIAVSMNKKPYLNFITGDSTNLDNLYVPAGVQEFHVSIKSGGQDFESKGVSEDFKAKKKKTLRIELTENGNSLSSATVPLPKDVQVYLSFPFVLSDVF